MYLEPLGDFISLLREEGEGKNILQKRFKKDPDSLITLFEIIHKIDELGYIRGMEFALSSHYIDTISTNENLNLIEIRVRDNLWRVITYNSVITRQLVLLDAFEHHKHTRMQEMVKRVKHCVPIVRDLLKEAI